MSTDQRPLRADARRNRERLLASARELFARTGHASTEEIAAHASVGIATVYRHFPTKEALLTALVRDRFQGFVDMAHAAEDITDPFEALEAILRGYGEAADDDKGFQLAMLGSNDLAWDGIEQEKNAFAEAVTRVINRAIAAGVVRHDLTFNDFPMLTCGILATMYFKPGGNDDWRRHLQLALDSIRTPNSKRN